MIKHLLLKRFALLNDIYWDVFCLKCSNIFLGQLLKFILIQIQVNLADYFYQFLFKGSADFSTEEYDFNVTSDQLIRDAL